MNETLFISICVYFTVGIICALTMMAVAVSLRVTEKHKTSVICFSFFLAIVGWFLLPVLLRKQHKKREQKQKNFENFKENLNQSFKRSNINY